MKIRPVRLVLCCCWTFAILVGLMSIPTRAALPELPELPSSCDKPAYLVVIATITDPIKSRDYVTALKASGLYPALGGFYVTAGKSPQVLEGAMFDKSPIVVAKFPCVAAAQRFWYSDVYQQKILPLREGAGTFEVAIFEERIDLMQP
jgi:uncharacterized protein (DUF1330 family)